MKLHRILPSVSAVVIACAASAPAFSQTTPGFYAGAAVGQSDARDFDDEDTAWKVFGGYQFNQALGAELGYVDLGNFAGTVSGVAANSDAKAVELVGVGTLPIAPRFSAYGKAGAFYWDADTTAPGLNPSGDGTDFTFGAGLKYDFTNNMGARLEWQRYQDVGDITDVDLISVGLVAKF